MISKKNLTEYEKSEARKNTFVILGLTGRGKSLIIKFLTRDPNAIVSSSTSSCTSYPSLFYGSIQSDLYPQKYFCLIDTAGFCDSQGKDKDKKNYNDINNILINNQCEIKGIFITENFNEDRLNDEDRKIYLGASDLFPLKKFWKYITIIYTHYYNKGSTNRKKIRIQRENEVINSLNQINQVIINRIDGIEPVNAKDIHKLYINIDDNVLEKKGFDLNDEDDRELYEKGLKDLEAAKTELYKEIIDKIIFEPLCDKIKNLGTHRILIKKEHDFFSYDIYEVYAELREFYLKNQIICNDIVQCNKPTIIQTEVNKIGFNLKKFGKGALFGFCAVDGALTVPVIKTMDFFFDVDDTYNDLKNYSNFFNRLNQMKNEWFPDERDNEYKRTKAY